MGLLDYTKSVFIADSEASARANAAFYNKVENRLKLLSQVCTQLDDSQRVMSLSARNIPQLPDNAANALYKSNFLTTDTWTSGSGSPTLSVSNGRLKAVATSSQIEIYKTGLSTSGGKKIRIFLSSSVSGNVGVAGYVSGAQITITTAICVAGIITVVDAIIPANNQYIYIYRVGCTVGDFIIVEAVYIGSGLYDTLAYDDACCNRFTNNGVRPVKSPRGQAFLFDGDSTLVCDNPVVGTTGAIAFKFKLGLLGTLQRIISNRNPSNGFNGFSIQQSASNTIEFVAAGASSVQGVYFGPFSETTNWHIVVVNFDGTNISYSFDNSTLVSTPQSVQIVQSATNMVIGAYADLSSKYKGLLADIRYRGTLYSQDDIARYNNGDESVDCQQKSQSNVPHSLVTRDSDGNIREPGLRVFADNAAALAGGLTKDSPYRTSTGIKMVVF